DVVDGRGYPGRGSVPEVAQVDRRLVGGVGRRRRGRLGLDHEAQGDDSAELCFQGVLDLGADALAAVAVDGVGQGEHGRPALDGEEAPRLVEGPGPARELAQDAVAPGQGELVAARETALGAPGTGGR